MPIGSGDRARSAPKAPLNRATRAFALRGDGVAATEFALIAPVLALLLLGVLDFGTMFWRQMQVTAAARAGAAYAASTGFNASAIASAVLANAPSGLGASPSPTEFCGCPNATSGVSTINPSSPPCSGTCPDGSIPGVYVNVGAQLSYKTVFDWPLLGRPTLLTASEMVRLQ